MRFQKQWACDLSFCHVYFHETNFGPIVYLKSFVWMGIAVARLHPQDWAGDSMHLLLSFGRGPLLPGNCCGFSWCARNWFSVGSCVVMYGNKTCLLQKYFALPWCQYSWKQFEHWVMHEVCRRVHDDSWVLFCIAGRLLLRVHGRVDLAREFLTACLLNGFLNFDTVARHSASISWHCCRILGSKPASILDIVCDGSYLNLIVLSAPHVATWSCLGRRCEGCKGETERQIQETALDSRSNIVSRGADDMFERLYDLQKIKESAESHHAIRVQDFVLENCARCRFLVQTGRFGLWHSWCSPKFKSNSKDIGWFHPRTAIHKRNYQWQWEEQQGFRWQQQYHHTYCAGHV